MNLALVDRVDSLSYGPNRFGEGSLGVRKGVTCTLVLKELNNYSEGTLLLPFLSRKRRVMWDMDVFRVDSVCESSRDYFLPPLITFFFPY